MKKLTKVQGVKAIKKYNSLWIITTPNFNYNVKGLGIPTKTTDFILKQINCFWCAKDCYIATNGSKIIVKIQGDYYETCMN